MARSARQSGTSASYGATSTTGAATSAISTATSATCARIVVTRRSPEQRRGRTPVRRGGNRSLRGSIGVLRRFAPQNDVGVLRLARAGFDELAGRREIRVLRRRGLHPA